MRPDGSAIRPPMSLAVARELDDVERRALWAYFQSLPPRPTDAR